MPAGSAKFRSTRRELSTKAEPEKRISQRERRSNIVSRAHCIAFVVCCVYTVLGKISPRALAPPYFVPLVPNFTAYPRDRLMQRTTTHASSRSTCFDTPPSLPLMPMPSLYPLCQFLFRRTCTCEARVQPHFCGRRDHPGYTPRKYERDYF